MQVSPSIVFTGGAADIDHLESMSLDELWALREVVRLILSEKYEVQRRELQQRLEALGRRFGGQSNIRRRHSRKILPKFQNPAQPSQTWSGRGSQPRWLRSMLEAGNSIEELRIPEATRNFSNSPACV
jgi:DNA-binding protein H-NS